MKIIVTLLVTVASAICSAQSFEPVMIQTAKFKYWADRPNRTNSYDHLTTCRYLTRINRDQTGIEMKIGVLDSNFDYFGTDLYIPESDFPLRENYYREFINPGASSYSMLYKDGVLEFKFLKKHGLWSLIYPFTLQIDPLLKQPGKFSGKMQGYDRDIFGQPKTHVTVECEF